MTWSVPIGPSYRLREGFFQLAFVGGWVFPIGDGDGGHFGVWWDFPIGRIPSSGSRRRHSIKGNMVMPQSANMLVISGPRRGMWRYLGKHPRIGGIYGGGWRYWGEYRDRCGVCGATIASATNGPSIKDCEATKFE